MFSLDGLRVAHFGDFGQAALRDEQAAAIGEVDLIFVPVGGGPTADAAQAREIVDRLGPQMGRADALPHAARSGSSRPADAFIEKFDEVHRCAEPSFETGDLPAAERPVVVVPAVP